MKKYNVEMWDKMQHIMEKYNDHMVHCYMEFDCKLDVIALKKAFEISFEKVPILKCAFIYDFFQAEWVEKRNFRVDDVFQSCIENDENKAQQLSEKFLTQKLDEKEIQIKILIIRCNNKDILNIVINHMVMDGADLKLFIDFIARSYTDIKSGGDGNVFFKSGSRDEKQVLKNFGPEERYKVENKLISYSKKVKDKVEFPFEKSEKHLRHPFIEKTVIPEDMFIRVKKTAKLWQVTINDLIIACFYRSVYKLITVSPEQAFGVPCMVDLRRYMKNGESLGATNLTSMIVCNIGKDIGEDIYETAKKVNYEMKKLKDNYPGLHGLPLLRKVFKYCPYGLAKFLIGTFFKNPLMGISNIGIVEEKTVNFNNRYPVYLYYTGSIKYPPYYQLALTTYLNKITFTTALYGTENDRLKAKELLYYIYEEFSKIATKNE